MRRLFVLVVLIIALICSGAAFSVDEFTDSVSDNVPDQVENISSEGAKEWANEAAETGSNIINETGERVSDFNQSDFTENISSSDIGKQFKNNNSFDLEEVETITAGLDIDEKTVSRIKRNMKVATEKLPENDTERIEKTVEVANEICSKSPELDELASSMNAVSDSKDDIKSMENAAGVLEERFGMDLNPEKFNDAYQSARDLSKFAPVVGSYGNLVNKSCAVEKTDNESIKDFYQASAYFGAEIVLVEAGVTYKVSSKAVRYMNSKAGMARIRGICGNECYSFVLSEAHWLFRGTQEGMKDYIMYESEDLGKSLEKEQIDNFMNSNSELFKKSLEKGQQITGGFISSAQNTGFFSKLISFFGL